MRKLLTILTLCLLYATQTLAQTAWVRYNQAGYESCRTSKRVVVISNSAITSTTAWTIKNASNVTVLNGTIGSSVSGANTWMPKGFNYVVDFSSLSTVGNYTFAMAGVTSVTLKIIDNPYEQYTDQVLRYFKVHRSGTADCLDHGLSHTGDASCKIYRRNGTNNASWSIDNTATPVDMQGGWYDAGDYIKFTLTCAYTTYNLLRAYELNPTIFQKKLYSQTNLVDILDESHHGLEYLMKTMPAGGTEFIIQVGGAADHNEGVRLPENDDLDGTRECYSAFSKTQMGYTAASLALGARIFNLIGETADATRYQNQAIAIFAKAESAGVADAWWEGGWEVFYADNSSNDNMMLAAIELYKLTGNVTYLNKAKTYANNAGAGYWAAWSESHMIGHWRMYADHTNSQNFLKADLNNFRTKANSTGNVWRMPHDFTWGSLYSFFDVANGAGTYYLTAADNQYNNMYWDVLDYTFGMNNWGMAFLANQTLPSAVTTSYSQFYKLQPSKFPIGEIVQGPGDKATHDDLGFSYGATWENEFNTADVVFYHRNNNYMCIETTICGVSDGLVLFAMAGKVSGCAPLPVEFLSFTASLNGSQVDLQWSTASEINSNQFHVQRSANGTDFTDITTVAAAGNSNTVKVYTYTDAAPLSGTSYYRIVEEDNSANLEYSVIRTVNSTATSVIKPVPNPFSESTIVDLQNLPAGCTIQLLDISGKLILQESAGTSWVYNPAGLPAGIYLLIVTSKDGTYTTRLIKE